MHRSLLARMGLPTLVSLLVASALAQAGGRPPVRPFERPSRTRTGPRPEIGPANAPVVLEVWGSMQCPYTAMFIRDVDAVLAAFPKLKIVWRNYPLAFHKDALPAAMAAEQVFKQKGHAAYWGFLKRVMANQRTLDPATLASFATQVGADGAQVTAALTAGTHRAAVEAEQRIGTAAGVKGTPAFFLNGKQLQGGYSRLPDFETRLRTALP